MLIGARDSVDACDSKTARNSALFSCPMPTVSCESCGELALVERVGGLKTASLWVVGLA